MYVVSGPSRPEPVELLDHAEPAGQPAHADVHGDRDAELAGQLPLRRHDLVLGEARPAGGERPW